MSQATAAPPTARAGRLRLYDIPERYRDIEDAIIEADGDITPEQEAALDHLSDEFERKAEYLALLSREAKAEAEAVAIEEKRLNKRRTAAKNRERRLKSYLHACLEKAGRDRVEGDRIKVRIQANTRPTIRWPFAPEEAPERFRRVTVDVDGTETYRAWKAGELPEGQGGFVVELGSHVRVW